MKVKLDDITIENAKLTDELEALRSTSKWEAQQALLNSSKSLDMVNQELKKKEEAYDKLSKDSKNERIVFETRIKNLENQVKSGEIKLKMIDDRAKRLVADNDRLVKSVEEKEEELRSLFTVRIQEAKDHNDEIGELNEKITELEAKVEASGPMPLGSQENANSDTEKRELELVVAQLEDTVEEANKRCKTLTETNQRLKNEIANVGTNYEQMKKENSDLKTAKKDIVKEGNSAIADLHTDLEKRDAMIATLKKDIEFKVSSIEKLELDLATEREKIEAIELSRVAEVERLEHELSVERQKVETQQHSVVNEVSQRVNVTTNGYNRSARPSVDLSMELALPPPFTPSPEPDNSLNGSFMSSATLVPTRVNENGPIVLNNYALSLIVDLARNNRAAGNGNGN